MSRMPDAPIRSPIVEGPSGITPREWAIWFRGVPDWIRPKLTRDATFYVRPNGNDNNNGLSDHPRGAWRTLQQAINFYEYLDTNGYDVTIQVADGTYEAGAVISHRLDSGRLIIQGNVETPANCIIATTDENCFRFAGHPSSSPATIRGFQLGTTTGGSALVVSGGSQVHLEAIDFAACADYHIHSMMGGIVIFDGDYSISGGAQCHWLADQIGSILLPSVGAVEVTLTGTPAFSDAFVKAHLISLIQSQQVYTWTGSATGKRYDVDGNSLLDTNGGGATYFPGDVAGTATNGGIYL